MEIFEMLCDALNPTNNEKLVKETEDSIIQKQVENKV